MAQPFELSESRLKPQTGEDSRSRSQPEQDRLQNARPRSPTRPGSAVNTSSTAHAVNNTTAEAADESRSGSGDKDQSNVTNAGFTERKPSGHDKHASNTAHAEGSIEDLRNSHDERKSTDASLPPTSPDMSNTQPPPGHPRQPMNYPSPTAFTPSGMPYAYPPAPSSQGQAYRVAGVAVNGPMTLPNIRTFDHLQPPPPQYGMPVISPMPPGGAQSQLPGFTNMHAYPGHPPDTMRFALPPGITTDPRIAMSGGRHKKEIKRRTKTGCLTCRKRRIKCDEGHPTCQNCKKSKRECLGYDPIFKPLSGPASIQSSANSKTSAPSPTFTPARSTSSAAAQASTSPAVSGSYPVSSRPDNTPSYDSSAPPALEIKPEPGLDDYSAPIDPALEVPASLPPSAAVSSLTSLGQILKAEDGTDRRPGQSSQARGGAPIFFNTLHALCYLQMHYKPRETTLTHANVPAKTMKVDELIALGGPYPPLPSSSPSPETIDEIMKLYYEVYVPGLGFFLETQWYDFKHDNKGTVNPLSILRNNQPVLNLFASFLQAISAITSTDPTDMVAAGHAETLVVWSLMNLPKSFAPTASSAPRPPDQVPPLDDHAEALNRLVVFETLLTGGTLTANPLTPPPSNNIDQPRRMGELEFWHFLGQYLHQSCASLDGVAARERILAHMRNLLDGRENRDVLYSIAVLREYTRQFDALMTEQTAPQHLEESDARSKLAVATRFIRDESTATGGTTNVVRRIADIAYRAFVKPGVNIGERIRST